MVSLEWHFMTDPKEKIYSESKGKNEGKERNTTDIENTNDKDEEGR